MTDRDRLGPPPIEPLSDVAWARVERGLWARMDEATPAVAIATRSRRWLWIAAPALAAAAVIAIVVTRGGDPVRGESDPVIFTSTTAASEVTFGDAHVTLDPDTAVMMSRDTKAPSAVVTRGGAWFSIVPRRDRPAFVVSAGETVVRVIGTRFHVARSEQHTVVAVERGLVDVQFRGAKLELAAGQQWSSERPGEIGSVAKTVQAEPDPQPEPAADEPGREPATPPAKPAKKTPAKKPPVTADEPATSSTASDRERFARAQALEVSDPRAAITGYLELARGSSRWAELALFAAGRLAADRREPRAATLLQMYLDRYPRGANADDVRELRAHLGGPR